MNYHYWFFVIVFITTVIPLHLIGIPFSLSKKSVYKVQNILYVLKMNYIFFVLSFFTVVPFLNQGSRGRMNTEMFINNRDNYMKITFTFLIVLMCIMIILAFFYVRRQVLAGIYSKKRYYSDYVVIPGVKSKSAYSLWTMLGFQIFLTSFVGKTFGTFEISIIFSIVLLYCFSFLFIENIFVLYLKIKFKLKENISIEEIERRTYKLNIYKILLWFFNSITGVIISLLLFISFFPYLVIIIDRYSSQIGNMTRWVYILIILVLLIRLIYVIFKKKNKRE